MAAEPDLAVINREVVKQHDASVKRLQDWIALPSIAAENLNSREGAEYMAKLAREAGFQKVTILDTDGKPGVFATLDAGAAKTVGLYFMYDVKQFDPAEWSSPRSQAHHRDKPAVGKASSAGGAVNQKGPQSAFLAACMQSAAPERKCQVNLVMSPRGEGNRFAAYRPTGQSTGSPGGAGQVDRSVHAVRIARAGWWRHR